jgi:hypothetical protein
VDQNAVPKQRSVELIVEIKLRGSVFACSWIESVWIVDTYEQLGTNKFGACSSQDRCSEQGRHALHRGTRPETCQGIAEADANRSDTVRWHRWAGIVFFESMKTRSRWNRKLKNIVGKRLIPLLNDCKSFLLVLKILTKDARACCLSFVVRVRAGRHEYRTLAEKLLHNHGT